VSFNPSATFAQKKAVAPVSQDLKAKEDELLRKEAALLKQLSAAENEIAVEPERAMIKNEAPAPALPRIAPSAPRLQEQSVAKTVMAKAAVPPSFEVARAPMAQQDGVSAQVLAEKERRIETLSKEITTLKNRLLLAETEVERLSAIIDERNRKNISAFTARRVELGGRPEIETGSTEVRRATAAIAQRPTDTKATEPTQDMQVVTVRAEKAHLRTGPGEDNSPLMSVARGTRLAVETRSGDWYRVISPAGTRAWVSSSVVVFGDLDPTRTTRVSGFNASIDKFPSADSRARGQR
jgi:SH3-like domain-containing protein